MSYPLVKISEFCKTGSGGTPSRGNSEFYDGDIPWIKSGELREKIIITASEFITELAVQKSSAKIVPAGSILLAMYGATVGRIAMLGIDATTNQAVCSIVPDEKIAFTKYVYYALLSKVPYFLNNAVGGAQPNISQGMIKDTEISLPPLDEQKRIAAILDKADSLRRKRQQAIQLADEFLRAVFLDLFGDPVTNPKGWEVKQLSELSIEKMNNGIFKKNEEYEDDGIPVAWVGELFRNHQIIFLDNPKCINVTKKELDKYGMYYGDILFCRSSLKLDGIGWNNVYLGEDKKALFECHLIRMRPNLNVINPIFLNYQLRFSGIRTRVFSHAKTVTMTTIDQNGLGKVEVVVPDKALQDRFEVLGKKLTNVLNRLTEQKDLNGLFNSLSQKAFAGEL